jgi:hypothetical protein
VFYCSGAWGRNSGVAMPTTLTGACVAVFSSNELLLVGGFSSVTNDYTDIAYILNIKTNKWSRKPWMALKEGPRIDASCGTINWNSNKHVIVAGGWNNSATMSSELFFEADLKFQTILKYESEEIMNQPLPIKLRSSQLSELNKTPILAGGVICTG